MSRTFRLMVLSTLVILAATLTALAADAQSKSGTVKSVDATAKTFVVNLEARPLTFTVNDKTKFTLDGKESTFEAAVKVDAKVTVSYSKDGEARVASKVDAKSVAAKDG